MKFIEKSKKVIFFLICIGIVRYSNGQNFTPPPAIPSYKILKGDSIYTTSADLNKHKPLMIIYFMPDCSHCQHLMYELKPVMKELKHIQIVMISASRTEYPYLKLLKTFSRDYDLAKYPNVTVGTEYPTYKVQQYYHVATTPFIAIYDKSGKPVKYIDKDPKVEDIVATVQKL